MKGGLLQKIRKDWTSAPGVPLLIEAFLDKINPDAMRFLTPQMFINSAPDMYALTWDMAKEVLLYLASERMGLLKLCFAIVDSNTENLIPLDADQVKAYIERQEPLINPDSGELVDDPEGAIILYFQGTPSLRELLRSRQ